MHTHGYDVGTRSTARVPAGDRAEFWNEAIRSVRGTRLLDHPGRAPFNGVLTQQRTSRFKLVSWAVSQRQTVRCTHDDAGGSPSYRLLLPTRQSTDLRVADEDTKLTPACAALIDGNTQIDLRHASGSAGIVVSLPRAEVIDRIGRPALPCSFPVTDGLGRLMASLLAGLVTERERLTGRAFDTVCTQAVELACMATMNHSPGPLTDTESLIRLHVRRHAHDPEFTGTRLARQLGWSLRRIQAVLSDVGTTPSQLIRETRLELARSRLTNPQEHARTITAIAHASGFSSIDAFEKAFRRQFDATPSEYRIRSGDVTTV
jgi:AraC-like DNA-binding protein